MVGVIFAIACWAVWFLSPQNVSLLAFERDAMVAGEWWRLWTMHLTHNKLSHLILNSIIIAIMGLMISQFSKVWHILVSLLIAMPVMAGLLLVVSPHLMSYRGAFGVTAVIVMLAVWFLILESKRFSLGYWIGIGLLLLFAMKVGIETLMVFSPVSRGLNGMHVDWLIQGFGVLIGLVVFNALHQIYATKTNKHKHTHGSTAVRRPKSGPNAPSSPRR